MDREDSRHRRSVGKEMKSKLYKNRAWLTQKYFYEKKSAEEIAAICGVTKQTIFNALNQFGLLKGKR
jgi:DNA-directed RNA polymerase specialized sigma subunit